MNINAELRITVAANERSAKLDIMLEKIARDSIRRTGSLAAFECKIQTNGGIDVTLSMHSDAGIRRVLNQVIDALPLEPIEPPEPGMRYRRDIMDEWTEDMIRVHYEANFGSSGQTTANEMLSKLLNIGRKQ